MNKLCFLVEADPVDGTPGGIDEDEGVDEKTRGREDDADGGDRNETPG